MKLRILVDQLGHLLGQISEKTKVAELRDFADDVDVLHDELKDETVIVADLIETLLKYHRDYHTEVSPQFCMLPCQLAAAL